MKKNLFLILFALITQFAFAQDFWTKMEMPQGITTVHAMASNSQGWTYFATNKGVYFTKDSGESITPTALQHVVYQLTINERDELFAFYYDKMYLSIDMGNSWFEYSLPVSKAPHSCYAKGDVIIYGVNSEIYKSQDLGQTWAKVWMFDGSIEPKVAVLFEKSNHQLLAGMFTLVVGSKDKEQNQEHATGIYSSDNAGDDWTYSTLEPVNVVSIAESSKDYLFAACYNGFIGLYLTKDNGNN